VDPSEPPLAFVVGAQRSGTTWVQRLLGAHPLVAAGQESHLFSGYLAPLWQRWWDERVARAAGSRRIGLACYLTEDELVAALRRFAGQALGKLAAARPGARLVAEKTPDHALHLPLIALLFPRAALVHVLRDGRDVVASLCDAHRRGWGRGWAPARAAEAAQRWADWVWEIRRQSAFFARYVEVRFEDLVADGPAALGRLYESLGLPLPAAEAAAVCRRFGFAACAAGTAPESLVYTGECSAPNAVEPEGFYRRGRPGAWREELSPEEQEIVHRVAGPMLREAGYAVESGPARPADQAA
jgi:hypothetical protein